MLFSIRVSITCFTRRHPLWLKWKRNRSCIRCIASNYNESQRWSHVLSLLTTLYFSLHKEECSRNLFDMLHGGENIYVNSSKKGHTVLLDDLFDKNHCKIGTFLFSDIRMAIKIWTNNKKWKWMRKFIGPSSGAKSDEIQLFLCMCGVCVNEPKIISDSHTHTNV